jgi:hypothetical protein
MREGVGEADTAAMEEVTEAVMSVVPLAMMVRCMADTTAAGTAGFGIPLTGPRRHGSNGYRHPYLVNSQQAKGS